MAAHEHRARRWVRAAGVALLCLVAWLVLAVVIGLSLFLGSARTVTLAGHDARLSPTLDGQVTLTTGPILPDLRMSSGSRVGADIDLGKTEAGSLQELVARYGAIAAAPEGQEAKIRAVVTSMAVTAAVRGAAIGLLPVLVGVGGWWLLGPARRRELGAGLRRGVRSRRALLVAPVAGGTVLVLVLAVVQPWHAGDERTPAGRWTTLEAFLGSEVQVTLPAELASVQVRGDVTTDQTRRLLESAIGSFDASQQFYDDAVEAVEDLDLREPEQDDTVVVLVSDRHDNVGMDRVVRALAERGGATAVLDAGDDTSTGSAWEDFSLDSLDTATRDLDGLEGRWAVAGNHDHGGFMSSYLSDRGWTMLQGEVVDGPGGTTLLGIPDPRSSGLGAWRDTPGMSFSEAEERLADVACEAQEEGQRIDTLLVHDANLGREALSRGCADLVLGGHVHVASGPTEVVGENGETGWSYTTGTTGGAAYAFALGKPRRTAQVTLLTYRDGEPYGLQAVELKTNGVFDVDEFVELG